MLLVQPKYGHWSVRCDQHPDAERVTNHKSFTTDLVLGHLCECSGPAFRISWRLGEIYERRQRIWIVEVFVPEEARWEFVSEEPTHVRAISRAKRYAREVPA